MGRFLDIRDVYQGAMAVANVSPFGRHGKEGRHCSVACETHRTGRILRTDNPKRLIARSGDRAEAGQILERSPPPVQVAPGAEEVLGVAGDVALQELESLVVIPDERARECLPPRHLLAERGGPPVPGAEQHLAGAVLEPGPAQDGTYGRESLVVLGGTQAGGCQRVESREQAPRRGGVKGAGGRRHYPQLAVHANGNPGGTPRTLLSRGAGPRAQTSRT